MKLIGCWRFTGNPRQNGVVKVRNNEITPLRPDSVVGEFTKASESRISEIVFVRASFAVFLTRWRACVVREQPLPSGSLENVGD